MKNTVVARNYAEALIAVARQENAVERFGELLDAVAGAFATNPAVQGVLMSPRVRKAAKKDVLAKSLHGLASEGFVRFLQAVVQRGRQGMFREMSEAYQDLADRHFNRVHASVTTVREADATFRAVIAERLTKAIGKTVLPNYRTDKAIIGGVVVRVGDRVLDGSIRRRLQLLRSKMLGTTGGGSL